MALAALVVSGLASSASAGGFAAARFGGEHGHPTTENLTGIYYNPAGLALGSGTRLYIEGLFVYRTATYDRPVGAIDNVVTDGSTGTPQSDVAANSGEAELANALVSPFFGVASDLGIPNLGVGFAVYAPFGGQGEWNTNSAYANNQMYPGAVDGVQRWTVINGSIRALYLTAGGAYRLPNQRLSIGATVNAIRSSVNTVRARTVSGTDDLIGSNGSIVEGRSLVEVASTELSVGLGVIWQPTKRSWVGVSYQSQPGFGRTRSAGTLTNKFGDGPETPSDVELLQELPDIIRVGARFRPIDKLELRVAADYTRWSVFETQCLVGEGSGSDCELTETGAAAPGESGVISNVLRRFEDTYGARVGATYWLRPTLELGGSLAYDSNAVPDETLDASFIDAGKIIANVEGRYAIMDGKLVLSAGLSHVMYGERDVAPRARDGMGVPIGFEGPSQVPDGAGTYNTQITFLTLGAQYSF